MKKSSQKLIMKLLIFVTLLAEQICISFAATGLREKKKKNPGAKLNHSKLCPELPTAFEKCLFSRHD